MEFLSEAVDTIRKEKNSKLTFAFSRKGMEYWVSDPFKDGYCTSAIVLSVRKPDDRNAELVIGLPFLNIEKRDGFSPAEVKDVHRFVWSDQACIFKHSPGFMAKYGSMIGSV